MKLVIIESPLGTNSDGTRCTDEQFKRNQEYVFACMLDSLIKGETPFASHALYPLVLKDADPSERRLGMEAGFNIAKAFYWATHGAYEYGEDVEVICAVYSDRGESSGMTEGIKQHKTNGFKIEKRYLGRDWAN